VTLRDYQFDAVRAVLWSLATKPEANPCAVLPTGAGKSVVLAEVARTAVQEWHGRVLVVAHVKELLEQNAAKIRALCPGVPVGIHSAGLGRRDTDEPIVVAGVQSAVRRLEELGRYDLVIVDECFTAGTKIDTPNGACNIEDAFVGQAVFNAGGVGRVEAVSVRPAKTLCKVELSNGTTIECTPNHPFFTESGWCKAGALAVGARVFCRKEVSDLRNRVSSEDLPGLARESDQVRGGEPLESARLLFAGVPMERTEETEAAKAAEAGSTTESVNVERAGEDGEENLPVLRNGVSAAILRREAGRQGIVESSEVLLDPMREAYGESRVREDGQNAQLDTSKEEGRQRSGNAGIAETDAGVSFGSCGRGASDCHDIGAASARASSRGEAGRRDSFLEARGRAGRKVAQELQGSGRGQAEESRACGARVVRVEIVELARPVAVFNLQVSGSPTYFADGVLVHNCHLIPPEGEGQYRTLLASLRETNPRLRVAGFTATPFRLDGGLICGEGKILTEVCYEIGVRALIDGGWLSPLTSRTHDAGAKLEGLHLRGGEFVAEEAAEAMGARGVVLETVRDVARRTADRRSVLVFCSGVDHAREMAGRLAEFGESAVLTGETPAAERAEILRRFRGEVSRDLFGAATEKPLKFLCNVGVLTTGFDAPNCDCVVLARATMSTGLYVQMVGRGFRKCEGKKDCRVLDYADNILRHGPVDAIDIRKGTGPRETWRRCPKCDAPVPRKAEACPECGAEMPKQERGPREMAGGVYGSASGASILADEGFADVAEVKGEFWERHEKRLKKGDAPKPPTVQITYYVGPNRNYREWLCVEHPARSFPRNKFESWWKKHAPGAPVPATCDEAVALFDAGWTRAVRQVTVERKPGEKYVSVVDWGLDAKTRRELAPETYAALENPEPTAEHGDAWEGDDPAAPAPTQAAQADPWDVDEDNLPF